MIGCLYREKGGAYGSGATAGDGVFTFFSYRYQYSLFPLCMLEDCCKVSSPLKCCVHFQCRAFDQG